jgi:hypothetical protein
VRLVSAKTFSSQYFAEGDRPDPRTVHSWVAKGAVPGRIINKVAYVDAEAFEHSTGNTLADSILRNLSKPSTPIAGSGTSVDGRPRRIDH